MSKIIIALFSTIIAFNVYAQAKAGDDVQPVQEKKLRKAETGKGLPTSTDTTKQKQFKAGDDVQAKQEKDLRKAETGKGMPTATDTTKQKQFKAGDDIQPKVEDKTRVAEGKQMPAAKPTPAATDKK